MEKNEQLTLIFFAIVILLFVVDMFVTSEIFSIIIALIQFGFSVAGVVYSIKLIAQKKLGFGITFLILFSIMLLMFIIAFFVGFIIGLSGVLDESAMTGNFIANLIKT
ncbi:MAG: hypothetical protein QXM68_02630 [Candidatus Aenigmatarchaeota archaeon]|nr:hypothetical protein [Candidatus Aenigmarchaeota archaeon]